MAPHFGGRRAAGSKRRAQASAGACWALTFADVAAAYLIVRAFLRYARTMGEALADVERTASSLLTSMCINVKKPLIKREVHRQALAPGR
eukprot:6167379-Pleurochrysis_carterae.AAC.1